MALRLNGYVAKCLHGKKLELKVDGSKYDSESNPLLAFQNHFNLSRSFSQDIIGQDLWKQMRSIADDAEMPESPFDYWEK